MVFSSLPPYLDPSNWHQHQQHQLAGNGGNDLNPQLSTPPPQSQVQQPHLGGSIRPGSMSDRARVANLMPETALKCPRCESTNTKFCYFNNYSLSQPRHFCKTCRRYWTRGGALRNVPVGGGCRRNKRSKSKSSASTGHASSACANSASTSLVLPNNNNSSTTAVAADILSLAPQLRFMSPFQHLTDFTANGDMGLNYNGILGAPSVASDMNFPIGISNLLGSGGGSSSSSSFLMGGGAQQFPFMNGGGGGELIESQTMGLYPLDQVEDGGGFEQPGCVGVRPNYKINGSSALSQQLASVKIEDGNNNANYRSRHGYYLLNDHLQQQNYYWNGGSGGGGGAAAWTDLSAGFSSSSATNSNPI